MDMAMRQRLGGISSTRPRQSYRSIYEDFKPHFELKEEQEAHVIHVHLPGFVKEQVKTTFAAFPGVIKVDGQRPLGNNKWSRFNQTFPIQENSDASKIHGKFNNQILTITIPKLSITHVGRKEAAKPSQQAPPTTSKTPTASAAEAKPQILQEDLIPSKPGLTATAGPQKSRSSEPLIPTKPGFLTETAGPQKSWSSEPKAQKGQEVIPQAATSSAQAEKQRDKRSAPPAAGPQEAGAEPKAQNSTFSGRDEKERDDNNGGHPLGLPKSVAETKVLKDKDEALPKAISAIQNEKQRDEKRVIPLTSSEGGISEPKSQRGKDEIPPKIIDEKRVGFTGEHVDAKDQSGKPAEPKNAERVVETSLQKESEANERSKEAGAVPKILEKAKRKSKSSGSAVDREKLTEEDSIGVNVIAAANEAMRNLRKGVNDEEKQMLINMGAAVLVLLALGASVTYSSWSSGKAMN